MQLWARCCRAENGTCTSVRVHVYVYVYVGCTSEADPPGALSNVGDIREGEGVGGRAPAGLLRTGARGERG